MSLKTNCSSFKRLFIGKTPNPSKRHDERAVLIFSIAAPFCPSVASVFVCGLPDEHLSNLSLLLCTLTTLYMVFPPSPSPSLLCLQTLGGVGALAAGGCGELRCPPPAHTPSCHPSPLSRLCLHFPLTFFWGVFGTARAVLHSRAWLQLL